MRFFYGLLIIFFLLLSKICVGQQVEIEKVKSIDGVITTLYEVISGPAGQRDWDLFSSLYKDEAMMGTISKTRDGTLRYVSMTPSQYTERNDEYFKKNGFWEEEIARQVFQFGEMATVHTSYKIKSARDGKVIRRGINTVQLVFDQDRWWITNITWNNERDGNSIPEQLLENK